MAMAESTMPPHDAEAERGLLVAAYLSDHYVPRPILPRLVADDFYDHRWRACFLHMRKHGHDALPRQYTVALLDTQPPFIGLNEVDGAIARLKECRERRRIIYAAQVIAEKAWDLSEPFDKSNAKRLLNSLTDDAPAGERMVVEV